MTLIELRDRLTEIINENDRRFPNENRNQSTVYVVHKISKRVHEYSPIEYAEGSQYSFINNERGFVLTPDQEKSIRYGNNKRK